MPKPETECKYPQQNLPGNCNPHYHAAIVRLTDSESLRFQTVSSNSSKTVFSAKQMLSRSPPPSQIISQPLHPNILKLLSCNMR
ncbi:unnamed protein product [Hymenolepis diminuta]|uniref:Uncharacterized protein n=1 Tax=Hymenolepis diminuta TaxID=6216 RepID=A0A564Y369_HYMDI|nr:unnamed protein product [Hymenolepis diminuta]